MAPAPVDPRPVGRGPVARVLVGAISLYRTAISPLRPPTCRYLPTCSEYAVEAIGTHGSARGSWLALRRLLRCHPWHVGGHDPVPPLVDRRGPAPLSVAATAGRQPVMSRYQSPASQPPGVLEC